LKTSLQKRVLQRFFVTPKAGVNFSGVLIHADSSDRGQSVFADVKIHMPGENPEPVVGHTYIPNSNIAYVQEMPADADS
jgi:hypothetical protein